MNREQRRKQQRETKQSKQAPTQTPKKTQELKDAIALNKISSTLSSKIKRRVEELRQQDEFKDLQHVQVNYFNISKLGIKYQAKANKPVGMSYGDAVVNNTQDAPNQPKHYLCICVYFDEENLTSEIYQMMLGLTSKVHTWTYSKQDDIYIDELGVYVDRVDFEKDPEHEQEQAEEV